MSIEAPCPSPEALEDLLAGRMPPAMASAVRSHLAGCERCKQRAARPAPAPQAAKPTAEGVQKTAAPQFSFLHQALRPDELGRLSNYRILGLLGEGGMAHVFDAEDTTLNRPVALKVLRPEQCSTQMRERFLREAELLASVNHQNIVRIYAFGEDGLPFLAMERLPGESLDKRLERDFSIPVDKALWITRQVAEGLAAAHDHQLIHRDVKPSNIWLEPAAKGRQRRAVLLDFGIARRTNDDRNLTTIGQVIGTPSYMAPEQAMGLPVDRRADIYSLGCVLYQMVTGHSPFDKEGKETVAVLEAVIKGEPPAVDWKVPSLPVPVALLIKDMMSRDVREQQTNAAALIERIDHINDQPAIVPTASTARPTRQADRVGVVLFGVVAVVAVGILAFGLLKWLGPPGPPIKVGILHSLTGPLSGHEKPIVHATRLAIDEINASGGVLGRQLEPIQADGTSKEEDFEAMASRLITQDEVKVIFGCWTSSSRKRVGAVCQREGCLLFYPDNYEGLGENPYVVYLGGTPNQTFLPLVNWAHRDLKKRKFFLLGSENVFSHTANAILRHEIEKGLKAQVAGEMYAAVGRTTMDEYAKAIKDSGADFVINTLDIQSNVPLVKALRDRGITPTTAPTAWCSFSESELSQFHKGELEGDYSVANYFESLDVRSNREFVKRFHARFSAERVNDAMQTAYAGVYLWKKAVEKAGTTDTEKVREALVGMSVDAPEGTIRLSNDLHAYRVPMIGQIIFRDGKYQFRKVAGGDEPVRPEPVPPWWRRDEWHDFQRGLFQRWGQKWEKH